MSRAELPADAVGNRYRCERGPWITAVLRCPEVVGTTQHVGLALASYGDPAGGCCFPGNRRLAREIGRTERTVERGLAELYRDGWLTQQAPATRNRATVWCLTTPFDPGVNPPAWLAGAAT